MFPSSQYNRNPYPNQHPARTPSLREARSEQGRPGFYGPNDEHYGLPGRRTRSTNQYDGYHPFLPLQPSMPFAIQTPMAAEHIGGGTAMPTGQFPMYPPVEPVVLNTADPSLLSVYGSAVTQWRHIAFSDSQPPPILSSDAYTSIPLWTSPSFLTAIETSRDMSQRYIEEGKWTVPISQSSSSQQLMQPAVREMTAGSFLSNDASMRPMTREAGPDTFAAMTSDYHRHPSAPSFSVETRYSRRGPPELPLTSSAQPLSFRTLPPHNIANNVFAAVPSSHQTDHHSYYEEVSALTDANQHPFSFFVPPPTFSDNGGGRRRNIQQSQQPTRHPEPHGIHFSHYEAGNAFSFYRPVTESWNEMWNALPSTSPSSSGGLNSVILWSPPSSPQSSQNMQGSQQHPQTTRHVFSALGAESQTTAHLHRHLQAPLGSQVIATATTAAQGENAWTQRVATVAARSMAKANHSLFRPLRVDVTSRTPAGVSRRRQCPCQSNNPRPSYSALCATAREHLRNRKARGSDVANAWGERETLRTREMLGQCFYALEVQFRHVKLTSGRPRGHRAPIVVTEVSPLLEDSAAVETIAGLTWATRLRRQRQAMMQISPLVVRTIVRSADNTNGNRTSVTVVQRLSASVRVASRTADDRFG